VAVLITALRWSRSELPPLWPLLLLAVPVVALLARFPLVIVGGTVGIEIGLDPAVLNYYLVLVAPEALCGRCHS
jgi:hypothetical protein